MIQKADSWKGRGARKQINRFDGVKNQAILEPDLVKEAQDEQVDESEATRKPSRKKLKK